MFQAVPGTSKEAPREAKSATRDIDGGSSVVIFGARGSPKYTYFVCIRIKTGQQETGELETGELVIGTRKLVNWKLVPRI